MSKTKELKTNPTKLTSTAKIKILPKTKTSISPHSFIPLKNSWAPLSMLTRTRQPSPQKIKSKNHPISIRSISEIDLLSLICLISKMQRLITKNFNIGLENSPQKFWVSPSFTWRKKRWITIRLKHSLQRVFWETLSFSQIISVWKTKKWSSLTPNSSKKSFLTWLRSTHWPTRRKSIKIFRPKSNPSTIPKFSKMITFFLPMLSLNSEKAVDTTI